MGFIEDHLELLGFLIFVLVAIWSIQKRKQQHRKAQRVLDEVTRARQNEPLSLHPQIDLAKCTGCAACVAVCPEGDILKLINHQAVLVKPTKCVGHGECERSCPRNAITLVFGTKTRGLEIPRISSNYETNVKGLYIAGELGGMGLIRNAVKQGTMAATHALENLSNKVQADVDLLVIGAGPAGISASLTAIEKNKSYLCIEQNTFGGTIANFPRQKIVMTAPARLPVYGEMKFRGNKVAKEELLELWNDVRASTKLKIKEKTEFKKFEIKDGIFHVETNTGVILTQKIILATGVRGSPRRLGLKNEDLPKVTYNLIEPEQYQGQNISIVGAGNSAVEAAIALGKSELANVVTLLVRGAGLDRCNDENQRAIEAMAKTGQVDIWFESSVTEIQTDRIKIQKSGKTIDLQNNYLFIFAGAELPSKMLMGLGVQLEKKFGEGLSQNR